MKMPIHKCGYTGGMNKDTSPNNYPNTCYFDATNHRVVTSDTAGLSDTALSTIKGNSTSFTIPNSGVLLGHVVLRDNLILLVKATGQPNPDRVYQIPLSSLRTASNITLDNVYYWQPGTHYLVYWNTLGFNLNNKIRVVANYETPSVQKIYWIDGLNPLRHLNIVYNSTYNNLSSLSSELLEISPNHIYGTYTLTETAGGNLKAGRIQYSYQLYAVNGTETMFAPPSNLYNLTTYRTSDSKDFVGNDIETIVNKAINVTITLDTNVAQTFNRIRLIALEYEVYGDVPKCRVVSERELPSNVITITDYGNTIGELTLEEFKLIKNDLIPNTIESVKSHLFVGNVTEEYFDVDSLVESLPGQARDFLDTRAYRWRYVPLGKNISAAQILDQTTDPHAITDTPAYGSASFNTSPVLPLATDINDSGWDITIRIGAPQDATAAGRTLVDISRIVSTDITVKYHTTGGAWDNTLYLNSPEGFTYTAEDANHGLLRIWGSNYSLGFLPSSITLADCDKVAVIALSYEYTYTVVSAGISCDCVLNKGSIQDSHEFVVSDGVTPVNFDVPYDHDCVNTYNNIENDENLNGEYDYKFKNIMGVGGLTGSNLGGTGRYISYGFASTSQLVGTVENVGLVGDQHPIITSNSAYNSGYKDPAFVLSYTNYQRDEVYRHGIQFYDLKGRPSFTKWIGDIRYPRMSDEIVPGVSWSTYYSLGSGDVNTMNIDTLGIEFTIDWDAIEADHPGLIAQLSGFQFVRMLRTSNDCTIKASGVIVPTGLAAVSGLVRATCYSTYQIASGHDYSITTLPALAGITGANMNMYRGLVELISPEVVYNKELTIDKGNDILQVVGYLEYITTKIGTTGRDGYTLSSTVVIPYATTNAHIKNDWRAVVYDGLICGPESKNTPSYTIDSTGYTARGYDGELAAALPEMCYKGTTLVAGIHVPFSATSTGAPGDGKAMYGYYRKKLGYSIYGGCTYAERSYNEYIKAGEFTEVSTSGAVAYTVYGGDTYTSPFPFLKLGYDTDPEYTGKSGQVFITFPVESKINVGLKLDKIEKYFYPDATPGYYLSENQTTGVTQYPNAYPSELGNLYRYNSAYSAENISKTFKSKAFDFVDTIVRDTLVVNSEAKFPGEYQDSWINFKFNNYKDLEGEYGAITKLVAKNDRLFAFQPRGIATLSVLEREVIQTNNTESLAVGTGGILERYDYLSKEVGTSIYDAIVDTESGIYFYDNYNYSIYRIGDTLEPISDTKNMKSYFSSNKFTSLITAYDKRNREVLFSPATAHAKNTLAFSGFIDAFSSFYSFKNLAGSSYVCNYITFDKYLLSSIDGTTFYLHDVGNYNQFYGETHPSTLTVLANPQGDLPVSFQVISWLTDVTNAGVEVPSETFANVRVTNTYQDTGTLTLPGDTGLMRRFRTWRMNVFRDSLIGGSYGRIRDSWCKAYFTYSPLVANNKLIIYPINFSWWSTKIQ